LAKITRAEVAAQARREMLRAALAVVQGGPDRVKDFRDPAGEGPFEFKPLGQGFELRSKAVVQDKPVAVTFGPPAK
jgi:hypothetical protein